MSLLPFQFQGVRAAFLHLCLPLLTFLFLFLTLRDGVWGDSAHIRLWFPGFACIRDSRHGAAPTSCPHHRFGMWTWGVTAHLHWDKFYPRRMKSCPQVLRAWVISPYLKLNLDASPAWDLRGLVNPILKLRCPRRLWSLQECNETKDSINSEIMNILRDTCRSIIDDEGSTNIKWERGGNVDERTEHVETKMRGEGAAYREGSGYSLESHWQWKLLNCVQVQTSSTLCLSLEKCWWEAA